MSAKDPRGLDGRIADLRERAEASIESTWAHVFEDRDVALLCDEIDALRERLVSAESLASNARNGRALWQKSARKASDNRDTWMAEALALRVDVKALRARLADQQAVIDAAKAWARDDTDGTEAALFDAVARLTDRETP